MPLGLMNEKPAVRKEVRVGDKDQTGGRRQEIC